MRKSDSRKGILFLVGGFKVGGTEKHLSLILPRLDSDLWNIHIRMLGEDGPLSEKIWGAGLDVGIIKPNYKLKIPKVRALQGLWFQVWQISREIISVNPFALHCFLQTPAIVGWLSSCIAHKGNLVIVSKRNQFSQQGSFVGEKWLERQALRSADHVLGHSTAVVEELKGIGISPAKIHLIPSGIDLQPFSEAPGRNEVRAREGWPPQVIVYVVLANLIPYKGHEDLFLALKRLEHNGPDWRAVLIGSGLQERELSLKRLAARYGLNDRVVFCGPRSDIPAMLSGADIGVLPSHHEGFSNALLEYMAAGLPVVATKVGGNTDAVIDGETGILVPAASPDALAEALDRMRLDASLRINMGQAGRTRVSECFSLTRCVKSYESFYRSLLKA